METLPFNLYPHLTPAPKKKEDKKRVVWRIRVKQPFIYIMESFSSSVFSKVVSICSEVFCLLLHIKMLFLQWQVSQGSAGPFVLTDWDSMNFTNTSKQGMMAQARGSWEANLNCIVSCWPAWATCETLSQEKK